MRLLRIISGCAALVLFSPAAYAFQETQGGTAAPQTAPGGQVPAGKPLDFGSELPAEKPSEGTEVRIPGLGKLGVLPKLDFGLELLYGVNGADKQPQLDSNPQDPGDDGMQIKGTFKHRF